MIIVVGGIKGGSGKTTLATNLTVLHAAAGKKTLLTDADDQRSASDWVMQRESLGIASISWTTIQLTGMYANRQLEKLKHEFDSIIIDAGGRDTTSQRSLLSVADTLLIPFKPRSLDVWTIGLVNTLVSDVKKLNKKLRVLAVINQADTRGEDNIASESIIKEYSQIKCCQTRIGTRKAFANAATEGLGVIELKPQDKKACDEISGLYQELFV